MIRPLASSLRPALAAAALAVTVLAASAAPPPARG